MRPLLFLASLLLFATSCSKDDADEMEPTKTIGLTGNYVGQVPSTNSNPDTDVTLNFGTTTLVPGESAQARFVFGDCIGSGCKGAGSGPATVNLTTANKLTLTCPACDNPYGNERFNMAATGTVNGDTIRLNVTGTWNIGNVTLIKKR